MAGSDLEHNPQHCSGIPSTSSKIWVALCLTTIRAGTHIILEPLALQELVLPLNHCFNFLLIKRLKLH